MDFSKPNVSLANPSHMELDAALATGGGPWVRASAAGDRLEVLIGTVFSNASAHTYYGAPAEMWTLVSLPSDPADNTLRLTVSSYNKTATRLPESLFLRFNITQSPGAPVQWLAGKLDSWVDPTDTALGGNQHHHGVTRGIRAVRPSGASMTISSPQAGLAAFGHPFGLPTPWDGPPSPLDGAAFFLTGNTWGTNYPMWSPALASPWGDDANQLWSVDVSLQ